MANTEYTGGVVRNLDNIDNACYVTLDPFPISEGPRQEVLVGMFVPDFFLGRLVDIYKTRVSTQSDIVIHIVESGLASLEYEMPVERWSNVIKEMWRFRKSDNVHL